MIRMPSSLFKDVLNDLQKPHPVAFERVGFCVGRSAEMPASGSAIMVQRYLPIPDDLYIRDRSVGAAISGAAIRIAMAESMATGCSIIHVHYHHLTGPAFFSETDMVGNRAMLSSFRNACPQVPHGALVFSPSGAIAVLLVPGHSEHRPSRVTVVGYPLHLWGRTP